VCAAALCLGLAVGAGVTIGADATVAVGGNDAAAALHPTRMTPASKPIGLQMR